MNTTNGYKRLRDDFRQWVNQHATARLPLPTYGMVGLYIKKPYRQEGIDKLNGLLEQVESNNLALNVRETDSALSVIAYTPYRRPGRQVS